MKIIQQKLKYYDYQCECLTYQAILYYKLINLGIHYTLCHIFGSYNKDRFLNFPKYIGNCNKYLFCFSLDHLKYIKYSEGQTKLFSNI